jgi:NitT/TauT family transport system permease protein
VRRLLVATGFFVALVALWEVLARAGLWNPVLLPPPSKVGAYLVEAVKDGSILEATLVTARRLAIGYSIGLVLGLPLGFLTSRVKTAADTVGVAALGLQTLPSVCWAPVAMMWFGQTETAMIFIVVMGTLWSILLATEHGVGSVPHIYVRAARTMGSKRMHTLWSVVLPASLPFVLSGMKQGWAFAWRSLMAAEIYVTILTGFGLGQLLHNGREFLAMDQMFGVMLVIVLVGLVVDRALFAPVERALHRRWGTGRGRE